MTICILGFVRKTWRLLLVSFCSVDLFYLFWVQMTSLSHLLCLPCLYHDSVLEEASPVCVHTCVPRCVEGRGLRTHTHAQCVSVSACVQPGLKAFRRVWEKVWNLGMTSLSMMSFLQGDFGTCESLAEVTLSLLTPCNWQWKHGSPLQIEPCKIYQSIMLASVKMCLCEVLSVTQD